MVTCAQSDISGSYIVEHPGILVEVLSKTSAAYDRGFKLRKYKEIPSLRYYLLVSQNEYLIELYTRTAQENIWIYQNFERENDVVRFDIWDFEMSLKAIYENITFVPDEVL
jgi:Uma2 family endonuclease